MFKLLFNIFLVWCVWQFIKMFFAVKKVQSGLKNQMNEMQNKMDNTKQQTATKPNNNKEGEYIDYEEIK